MTDVIFIKQNSLFSVKLLIKNLYKLISNVKLPCIPIGIAYYYFHTFLDSIY